MDKSWMPTLAGILDIVAGAAALLGCLALGFSAIIVGNVPEAGEFPLPIVAGFLGCLSIAILVLSSIAILGGAIALQRKGWGWAVTGSIAAAVVCPPLGIPAVILTVLAEKEIRQSD